MLRESLYIAGILLVVKTFHLVGMEMAKTVNYRGI